NLLGLAIGLAAFEPLADQARGFGIGTVVWMLASAIISLFCGGWIAGRLAAGQPRLERALHGVVTWSVVTLFGLWLIGSGVAKALSGAANAAGDVAGAVAPAAASMTREGGGGGALPEDVQDDLEQLRADPELRTAILR